MHSDEDIEPESVEAWLKRMFKKLEKETSSSEFTLTDTCVTEMLSDLESCKSDKQDDEENHDTNSEQIISDKEHLSKMINETETIRECEKKLMHENSSEQLSREIFDFYF
jgi:hypothetical protein